MYQDLAISGKCVHGQLAVVLLNVVPSLTGCSTPDVNKKEP
jgi:hypothetical protein